MYYRFAASKEAIELNLIKHLKNSGPGFAVKKEDDFKGISFSFVWNRLSETEFQLICYHKGIFSILTEEFKSLLEEKPFGVINTVLYKELFSVTYQTDLNMKLKDTVYTDNIKFKFIDFFENEETMIHYIKQIFNKFAWSIQYQDDTGLWQDYDF